MTRVIILHGTKGSPDSNWFPWLASALSERGLQTLRPTLPTPDDQSLESWISAVHSHCGELSAERDILVGHSAGATLALRLLEATAVQSAYLVAPLISELGLTEYDTLNQSILAAPFQWDLIKRNCSKIKLFHGDNDPYVPLSHAVQIHCALNAPLTVIKSGGHLSSEAGLREFPLLRDAIVGEEVREG